MTKNTLTNLIDATLNETKDELRNYIGASSIGSDCLRQIWYQYKGYESIDASPKMRRTWLIGKELEFIVVNLLESAGLEIAHTWYDLESEKIPLFQGHVDAMWLKNGEAHAVIEIKTAKDASFKIFVNKGLKEWNQQYYAQLQSYMGMSGIHLGYILVLNKDNSELADEQVDFDSSYYSKLEEKAALIANATSEPPRISNSPLWYQCKSCKYRSICHT